MKLAFCELQIQFEIVTKIVSCMESFSHWKSFHTEVITDCVIITWTHLLF